MGSISLLQDEVINKIAAGEVVERPASVVKELVENSLDAGASEIRIELKAGGTDTILITDSGVGIAPEDAPLTIARHATSKIVGADDLFQISTYGFRGEALASIASISRMTIMSRKQGHSEGFRMDLEDGVPAKIEPWHGAIGTVIAVKDLFYNVPVRRKFLKSAALEYAHCLEWIQGLALSNPFTGFTLVHNGKVQLRTGVKAAELGATWLGEATLRQRCQEVLGLDEGLIYITAASRFGRVEALVSPPGVERSSARDIHMFVNQRRVRDKTLRFSILHGYHSHLLKGKFPVALVYLTTDPSLVDVNVHPAKTEVRFQYTKEIQNLISLAIRDALRGGSWAQRPAQESGTTAGLANAPWSAPPDFDLGPPRSTTWEHAPAIGPQGAEGQGSLGRSAAAQAIGGPAGLSAKAPAVPPSSWNSAARHQGVPRGTDLLNQSTPGQTPQTVYRTQRFDGPAAEPGSSPHATIPGQRPFGGGRFLGSFASCYLLVDAGDQLLVIDQHAFHERILFERLLKDHAAITRCQPLLVPEAIDLSPPAVARLAARRAELSPLGFRIEVMSDSLIEVKGVPALLVRRDLEAVIQELAGEDEATALSAPHTFTQTLATIACHAAVRAGEELDEQDLERLFLEAEGVDFYLNCPHGRPVFKWWPKTAVAAWFARA